MPDTLIPCAKCGIDVVVPEAQMQLMAGIPGRPIIQHELCPGVDDVAAEIDPTMRAFTVEVIVSDDDGVVTRFARTTTARSFLEATGLLGPLLTETWAQVLEHAAKVDVEPQETGTA